MAPVGPATPDIEPDPVPDLLTDDLARMFFGLGYRAEPDRLRAFPALDRLDLRQIRQGETPIAGHYRYSA